MGERGEISDDVLIEILVLLPPKSIFIFMCVSKKWKQIISDHFFMQKYSAAAPRRSSDGIRLLTFFHLLYSTGSKILPIQIPGQKSVINVPKRFGNFSNCSNGLILYLRSDTLRVLNNPVTGKFVQLPPLPPFEHDQMRPGIMSQENSTQLTPTYYVVLTGIDRYDVGRMHVLTYSSATGQWSGETVAAATEGSFKLEDEPPVVASGIFHWRARLYFGYTTREGVAVYDPIDGEDHLQLIEFPYDDGDVSDESYRMGISGDDLLWVGRIGNMRKRMRFSMLPKGEDGGNSYRRETAIKGDEWVLMYQFDVESFCIKSAQRLSLMALLKMKMKMK
ncbi:hypothetical protein C2S53_020470 [Perilla frutescens var. hirtella]|uniref:F-box domain-containing protein n=1 Tax=Perilla frutescens var. hirtella TaxID=608512 RepID=A0AAD4JRG8_PERFH|nr:hypothetical protein C2S53_020470 [Perilla frutescens var. hirtella]